MAVVDFNPQSCSARCASARLQGRLWRHRPARHAGPCRRRARRGADLHRAGLPAEGHHQRAAGAPASRDQPGRHDHRARPTSSPTSMPSISRGRRLRHRLPLHAESAELCTVLEAIDGGPLAEQARRARRPREGPARGAGVTPALARTSGGRRCPNQREVTGRGGTPRCASPTGRLRPDRRPLRDGEPRPCAR